MKKECWLGHLFAMLCAVVWGTTFLVSQNLLQIYTPVQVMLLRFLLGYAVMWVLCPKWQFHWRDELGFLLMSLFGNTLYFLAENWALTQTYTSNVSILVSSAPILTAILFLLTRQQEKLNRYLVSGILTAFLGVVLVVLNGSRLHLSPLGDLLSLGAALCWALYNLVLRRYSGRFSSVFITRKLMFYGLVTSIPLLILQGAPFDWGELLRPGNLLGLLYLGVIGSGLCYAAWNLAAEKLGVLQTNLYIYAIPFVTLISGALLLKESVTWMSVAGAALIVLGMLVSTRHPKESRTT